MHLYSNGWKVPEAPGCTLFLHPHQGWPAEDYDMIGNEAAIPSGEVVSEYQVGPEFRSDERYQRNFNLTNVRWITTLRHPYSRTMSHYHHVLRCGKEFVNLTLQDFLTQPYGNGYHKFIPNHMTRWHCGTGACVTSSNMLSRQDLQHAMDNLSKMSAVLILEDFSDPNSCTRRQIRHVLKFKQETLAEKKTATTNSTDETAPKKIEPELHRSDTNWEQAIRPYLNDQALSANDWSLKHPDQLGRGSFSTNSNNRTDVNQESLNATHTSVMAAMGFHNDMDLQLYGYAKHLCRILADKYDLEEKNVEQAAFDTLEADLAASFFYNDDKMFPPTPAENWSALTPTLSGPFSSQRLQSTITTNAKNVIDPVVNVSSVSVMLMYIVSMLGFVVFSHQGRRATNNNS